MNIVVKNERENSFPYPYYVVHFRRISMGIVIIHGKYCEVMYHDIARDRLNMNLHVYKNLPS